MELTSKYNLHGIEMVFLLFKGANYFCNNNNNNDTEGNTFSYKLIFPLRHSKYKI